MLDMAVWVRSLLQLEREEVPSSMMVKVVTLETSAQRSGWLKLVTDLNIDCIVVTSDTFHESTAWSNLVAP